MRCLRAHGWLGLPLSLCAWSCSERSLLIFESSPVAIGGSPSGGALANEPGGTGGSGGSGTSSAGTAAYAGAAGAPSSFVVDDFEDGDSLAFEPASWWYTVNDGTSSQSLTFELEPLRQSSALHTTGEAFTDWGAALGVNVDQPLDARLRVLRFKARAATDRDVVFQVIDESGTRFTHTAAVSSAWQEYSVRLDQLYAAQGDAFVPLDVSTVKTLHWFLFGGDAFDFWLDDVVFAAE